MIDPKHLALIIRKRSGSMRLMGKIVIFATLFSIMFFLLHAADVARTVIREDMEDLGGIPWLYSAVCLIFSILAGFVIQHEWDQWNDFVDAIKGEVSTLRSLWLWSQHVTDQGIKLRDAMKQYLTSRFRTNGAQAGRAKARRQDGLSPLYRKKPPHCFSIRT